MTQLSDVVAELESHLKNDTNVSNAFGSITTDAGYDAIPRGLRLHIRPVDNNANETELLGGRMRDAVVGLVIVGRHPKQSTSDTEFASAIEALDLATLSFVAVSNLTNRRTRFVCERDMADDYPEMRIEFASVSYRIVEV